MISRWQQNEVESALKYFRVVNLTGARQCGKTTLAGIAGVRPCRGVGFLEKWSQNNMGWLEKCRTAAPHSGPAMSQSLGMAPGTCLLAPK